MASFTEHFYGGLLDDELAKLAALPGNVTGYAVVNPPAGSNTIPPGGLTYAPGTTLTDTVDGKGIGRFFYRLAAVNPAGNPTQLDGVAGPYYTKLVMQPNRPVLYKVQPIPGALIVAWSIEENPNITGYLVYRASDSESPERPPGTSASPPGRRTTFIPSRRRFRN